MPTNPPAATSSIYGMEGLWVRLACGFISILEVVAGCLDSGRWHKFLERIRGAEPDPVIVGQSRSQIE
jgi:hypothetical protein